MTTNEKIKEFANILEKYKEDNKHFYDISCQSDNALITWGDKQCFQTAAAVLANYKKHFKEELG